MSRGQVLGIPHSRRNREHRCSLKRQQLGAREVKIVFIILVRRREHPFHGPSIIWPRSINEDISTHRQASRDRSHTAPFTPAYIIVLPRPILTIRPKRHQHAESLAVTYNRGKRSCLYSIVKYSSRQKTLLDIGPP